MKIFQMSAAIVTYKDDANTLKEAINSILKAHKSLKLYLIDNSPTDILRSLLTTDNRIEYIFNNDNIGFGAANNIAIKKAIQFGSKYHLVLNPDIHFESDALIKLLTYMDQNEDIGLIMPSIKYPNGQPQHLCKLLASPIDLLGRRFIPFKKWIEERNNIYELRFTGYNEIMNVPSLSGCFMLMRTEALIRTGGFDERFFMYCEDNDLSRRIGQIAKTIFYPEVTVTHNYEKGSYKNPKLLRYHIVSAIKYFNKWGWFFDKERKRINRETLLKLGYKN